MRVSADPVPADTSRTAVSALTALLLCGYVAYRSWVTVAHHERALFLPGSWDAGLMVDIHMLSSLGFCLSLAAIAVVARRMSRPLMSRGPVYVVTSCLFAAGVALSALVGNGWVPRTLPFVLMAGLLTGVATGPVFVMWGELYATLRHAWVRRCALAQLALPPVFLLTVFLPYPVTLAIEVVLPAASLGCLWAVRRRSDYKATLAPPVPVAGARSSGPLIVGVATISLGYGFLQTLVTRDLGNGTTTNLSVFVSYTASFAIAWLFFDRADDPDHARALRIIISLLVVGYLLLPLAGISAIQVVVATLVNAGFFLLEYLVIAALADVAGGVGTEATVLFALARIVVSGSVLVGMFLAAVMVPAALADLPSSALSWVTFMSVALLALAGLWLLTARNLHRFFWGADVASGGSVSSYQTDDSRLVPTGRCEAGMSREGMASQNLVSALYDNYTKGPAEACAFRCQQAARRFSLTEREVDILVLWVQGRSAPYIQEALSISGNTVATHLRHIYQKCDVHSRQELLTKLAEFAER